MLVDLSPDFTGTASPWLKEHAESRAEMVLSSLLYQAVVLWSKESFESFNQLEAALTVRLFGFCLRVIDADQKTFSQVDAVYESSQPTAAMLSGKSDPTKAPRPDMTIMMGRTKVRVEAKRLKPSGSLPRKYVKEGMLRFRDERYGLPGEPGVMIGYIISGDIPVIVRKINDVISSEWVHGDGEHLGPPTILGVNLQLHKSVHPPSLKLLHHMIDLRSIAVRAPSANACGSDVQQ
ncbi:MAG: hypothetical protein ACRDTE_29660 [Pseudonocardiaceae bacterium]